MSKDELTLFTSALNKHSSTESTIRRLRAKKSNIIGRMPTNQSEFDPDRLSSYDDQSKMIWGDECNPEGGRTIVMTTMFLLQYISSVTQISVDGTFFICSGWVNTWEVPQRSRKYPSASTSTFSLPMSTRMRIFSSLSTTPPKHNSTKRAREEDVDEDVFECSKKSKTDHSLCHICMFRLKKNNKKSRCHCKKLVHHSCFLGDGSICK